ncbi:uncharacterized protein LOC113782319 isoform X1 [Coffea eugenioides]|uniref:uncharacterized protein LOC113782319 isoform X1 n=1 Tax=Coffea eugenioides TaxID=49369 RepID=UPI000F612628|nr:uncharacterized protein LOC113782319 isoform X1 [Coffea eugenioides]
MAAQETVVLDISSDEDVGWGDNMSAAGCGGCRDDSDWISELLDKVDKETDDSDEVVVLGEVIAKPKFRPKPSVKCVDKVDDDDCVVLEADPDAPVAIENDKREDDPDELLVVSEKGQVACRDYPHARHLCVKFPFNSTPHDRHCEQCHCYVCDSLAPCLHWSTGISSIDHCHATDKEEFWKSQRKSSRKNDEAPPVAPDTSFSTGLAPPLPSDPSLQNQLFTQAAHQLSSMPSINGTQNNINHGRSQQSGNYTSVSPQLRSTYSHLIPGDRRHSAGNTGTRYISHVPLKRTRTCGDVLPANRYCNNSSRASHGYPSTRSHPSTTRWLDPVTPVISTFEDSSKAIVGGMATRMSSLPAVINMANGTANHPPSHPQMLRQTHGSSIDTSTVGPQRQLSSQMYGDFSITNPMPTQPGVAAQPNWDCPFDNSFPFQPLTTTNPNDTRFSQDPVPSESLVTSWANMSNCFEGAFPTQPNADSGFDNRLLHLPQECGQVASLSSHGEDTFKQGNQTRSTLHPSCAEFGFGWDSTPSHGQQLLADEYNRLEIAVQRDEPAVNADVGSQLYGSANSAPLDFHLDSWMFENQSALGALEVPVPPELNVFSPEAATIDAGLLFDF